MLYLLLKWMMTGTMRVFFKSVRVSHAERVPQKGPLLIVANHPSMLMDPVIVASILNRKVCFLAKGALFQTPFSKWVLPKLGIIPLHRVQDDPTQLGKNANTFKKCFEHFEQGGAILVFPEGVSITQRRLQPLKTGAARMAMGAEARNDNKLGMKILVVGLNYANQHKFNRDLLVHIQPPIDVAEFVRNNPGPSGKIADELTELIRTQLEAVIISVQDEQTDVLVSEIETLYKQRLIRERGVDKPDMETDVSVTRNIVKAVKYFEETDVTRFQSMQLRIHHYFSKLKVLDVQDEDLKDNSSLSFSTVHILTLIKLIVGFPVYLYGLINNIIPFQIPDWAGDQFKDKDMKGSVGMVVGMFTFIIFYTIQIFLVHHYFHAAWITLYYGLSLPLTGFFTYYYWYSFARLRASWHLINVFKKRKGTVSELVKEREGIINDLANMKTEFLTMHLQS